MRIGLIDVDGHASKKKWGATIYPNIALAKIARYHKLSGNTVEWYSAFCEHYDYVYMSKVFNFSPDYPYIIKNADHIIKGGTGYVTDIHTMPVLKRGQQTNYIFNLPYSIDRLQPDYSIYPNIPKDYAYGLLTRGCPNKCKWCVVPRKEGDIRPYMDVDEIAIEGRHKLVLMDNNFLAAGDYAHEQLDKIISRGYRVDFNQALDARLVNDEYARLLSAVPWIHHRIRFGCDTQRQIQEVERAIDLLTGYGFKGEVFLYTMIGGKSDFCESYSRVMYWWERHHAIRASHSGYGIYPYAQPYRDPDNPRAVPPQWQKDMAQWVNKHQIFAMTDFANFEPRKGFRCIEYMKQYGICP